MKLYTIVITSFLLCLLGVSNAQNNALVINNDAFVVINGGTDGNEAVIVIDQPHQNGIVTAGTGGNIITQGEFDYVKWNIGTSTGSYNVPFTTDVGNAKIPLNVSVTGAGTGSGYLALSSWDVSAGAGMADNTPWPSQVAHMGGANGLPDVSNYAVDRFWIIDHRDPLGTGETYSTEPAVTLNFNYNTAAAEVADGNVLTLGNLGAQQHDGAQGKWFGWFTGGSAQGIYGTDNGAGLVSGVIVPAGTFYRTWTLADYSSPLPVEIVNYDADCGAEGMVLSWQTESEINNDYFEIHRSINGLDYELIATVDGAGNSSNIINYEYIDETINANTAYYQLVQVDNDGVTREVDVIKTAPCVSNSGFNVFGTTNGDVRINWQAAKDGVYEVILFDALGKQISAPELLNVEEGYNQFDLQFSNLAFGSYLIQVISDTERISKKLVIQ